MSEEAKKEHTDELPNVAERGWDVSYDDESEIIRVWVDGVVDGEKAEHIVGGINKRRDDHPGAGVLVDAREIETMNGAAREHISKHIKSATEYKTAFFGGNKKFTVGAKMVHGSAGNEENIAMFDTEEEAMDWLQEE